MCVSCGNKAHKPKQVEGYHRELKDVMKKHSFGPTFVNKPKAKALAKKVTHDKNSPDYPDYFKHLDARAKRRGEQDM